MTWKTPTPGEHRIDLGRVGASLFCEPGMTRAHAYLGSTFWDTRSSAMPDDVREVLLSATPDTLRSVLLTKIRENLVDALAAVDAALKEGGDP